MSNASEYFTANCIFKNECHEKWEDLDKQESTGIRHCNKCQQDVYLCETVEQLMDVIAKNQCAAVPIPEVDDSKYTHWMGNITQRFIWLDTFTNKNK